MPEPDSGYLAAGGRRLYWAVAGAVPAVVAIHGGSAGLRMRESLVPALAESYDARTLPAGHDMILDTAWGQTATAIQTPISGILGDDGRDERWPVMNPARPGRSACGARRRRAGDGVRAGGPGHGPGGLGTMGAAGGGTCLAGAVFFARRG